MRAIMLSCLLAVTSCVLDEEPLPEEELEPDPAAGIRDDAPVLDKFEDPPPVPETEPEEPRQPQVVPVE